jgi:inorganic triphosphatase YgiF
MTPGREIELKFAVSAADLDAVLAAAPAGQDATLTLHSIYFDTPDAALAAAGTSLRVRDDGRRKVQTMKRGKGVSREEHEAEVTELDTSWPALAGLTLAPVSEVRILRRQRLVRFDGAEIEVAADVGEAVAGGRSEAFSELELELKSGPEAALHRLAAELGRAVPLTPSTTSKSDRGRALKGI